LITLGHCRSASDALLFYFRMISLLLAFSASFFASLLSDAFCTMMY